MTVEGAREGVGAIAVTSGGDWDFAFGEIEQPEKSINSANNAKGHDIIFRFTVLRCIQTSFHGRGEIDI